MSFLDLSNIDLSGGSIFDSGSSVLQDIPDFGGGASGLFDTGGLFSGGSGGIDFTNVLHQSPNLSASFPSQLSGGSGFLKDLGGLFGVVYQGESQLKLLKQQQALQDAKNANQLETIRTTPNVWLVGGVVLAGIFAFSALHSPAVVAAAAPARR